MTKKTFLGETNDNELEISLFDNFIEFSITDEDYKINFVHLTKFDIEELIDELNIYLAIMPEGGSNE